jgi:hypothetical protein
VTRRTLQRHVLRVVPGAESQTLRWLQWTERFS